MTNIISGPTNVGRSARETCKEEMHMTKEKLLETLTNSYTALSAFEDESNTEETELERVKILALLEIVQNSENDEESK